MHTHRTVIAQFHTFDNSGSCNLVAMISIACIVKRGPIFYLQISNPVWKILWDCSQSSVAAVNEIA